MGTEEGGGEGGLCLESCAGRRKTSVRKGETGKTDRLASARGGRRVQEEKGARLERGRAGGGLCPLQDPLFSFHTHLSLSLLPPSSPHFFQ